MTPRARRQTMAFCVTALVPCALFAQTAPQAPAPPGGAVFGSGAYRPGPDVSMPVAVLRPAPLYPKDGPAAHAAGTIVVEVVVRRDGTVGDVRLRDDSTGGQWPKLVPAAIDAARHWHFKPGERAGAPADVIVPIAFSFNLASPAGPLQMAQVYPVNSSGLVNPRPLHTEMPRYTAPAMRAKLQGQVTLAVVVDATGAVASARVVRSLDTVLGLDEQAIAAAKLWTFEPGRLNGTPVACQVTIVLTFKFH